MLRDLKAARFARAISASAALLAAYSFGCTLVTSRTNGQCSNLSDCRNRGAAFAQTYCAADGTCEAITLPDAGADASSTQCVSNKDCVSLGKARCLNNSCVALTNPQCTTVDGDPTDDNALFLGVMTPASGPYQALGANYYATVKAANSDWGKQIAGQANAHPFVTIRCDELADPAGTTQFLAGQAQVNAILGPIFDDNFEKAVPAVQNGTFLVSPSADDVKLPTLSGIGRIVWSYAVSRSIQAQYVASLMTIEEAQIKKALPEADGGTMPIKVFFAVADDTSTTGFADAAEAKLVFNGESASSQSGTAYSRVKVPYSETTTVDYSAVVSQMISFAPQLVIIPQNYDLFDFIVAIEQQWPATTPALPRFLFLHEDPATNQELLRPGNRIAGKVDYTTWALSANEAANYSAFQSVFNAAAQQNPSPGTERMYDAFYENAYAFQSVLDKNGNVTASIDSTSYAQALSGMNNPGTLTNVGGAAIPAMLNLLAAKGNPDFDGASGPLEFKQTTGSPIQDATLKCVKVGGAVASSGVTFDGTTGASTGSYSCL